MMVKGENLSLNFSGFLTARQKIPRLSTILPNGKCRKMTHSTFIFLSRRTRGILCIHYGKTREKHSVHSMFTGIWKTHCALFS